MYNLEIFMQDKVLSLNCTSFAQWYVLVIVLFSIRVAGEANLDIKVLSYVSLYFSMNLEKKSVSFYINLQHNVVIIVILDVKLRIVLLE